MSWYRDSSGVAHKRRASISVDNTAGSSGSIDVTITVPQDWDIFWSEVNQTDGRDIRVTGADGSTLVGYRLVGFSVSTRTLTIEVDNFVAPAGAMCQLWLYWNNASATSAAIVFVAASPKTGYIEVGAPVAPVYRAASESFKSTRPRNTASKQASETVYISVDVSAFLTGRIQGEGFVAGNQRYEEISHVSYRVLSGGSAQASMVSATRTRFIKGDIVMLYVTGGSDQSGYTVELTVTTTQGQVRMASIWLEVRTVDEA